MEEAGAGAVQRRCELRMGRRQREDREGDWEGEEKGGVAVWCGARADSVLEEWASQIDLDRSFADLAIPWLSKRSISCHSNRPTKGSCRAARGVGNGAHAAKAPADRVEALRAQCSSREPKKRKDKALGDIGGLNVRRARANTIPCWSRSGRDSGVFLVPPPFCYLLRRKRGPEIVHARR